MGISYDGVYFFGLLYDQFGKDEDGYSAEDQRWPVVSRAVLSGDPNEDERDVGFDDWLRGYLGVEDYEWREDAREEMRRLSLERAAKMKARCLEVFGVEGFESHWMGCLDYAVYTVNPVGAYLCEWRGARVPEWPAEQVAVWRAACERLRAVLPGAGEPGFYFGCQVG